MGTRDEYVKMAKSAFVTLTANGTLSVLSGYFPFLKIPFFNGIAQDLLEKFYEKVSNQGELAAFYKFIDVRVNKQGEAFQEAMQRNHLARNSEDIVEKANARKNLIEKHRLLVHLAS